jgi:hypothetical protein
MAEEIKFEVGQKYENMKGVFEVIAIRKDSMDLRWENGEEIDTPIALQRRIIERMQFEKEMEEAKKAQKAKKAKASTSKGGKQFAGLEPSDFTNSVSKTTWRGRGQIGGAVATRVKNKQFKFNSWAVLRKPEVNWLDIGRQKQEDVKLQAVFHARVEETALFCGIHVPCPEPAKTEETDWSVFLKWLEKEENNAWLAKQCNVHGLYLSDLNQKGIKGRLEYKDDHWVHIIGEKEAVVESLYDFLNDSGKSGAMSLRIEKEVEKEAVIEKKQAIAVDIAAMFESLMPLYVAIASRNG